jgi:hypothetical protein
MQLLLEKREIYGNTLYYPANEAAMVIPFLTGRKTISLSDINKLKQLGHIVELKQEVL